MSLIDWYRLNISRSYSNEIEFHFLYGVQTLEIDGMPVPGSIAEGESSTIVVTMEVTVAKAVCVTTTIAGEDSDAIGIPSGWKSTK